MTRPTLALRTTPASGARILTLLIAIATLAAAAASYVPTAVAQSGGTNPATASADEAYQTAFSYVTTFYPLWFTYMQSQNATPDQLVGPQTVTPLYQTVVAVNVDTLYASSYMDLSKEAAVLTIPSNSTTSNTPDVVFSVLVVDPYGQVLTDGFSFNAGQTYAFIGPNKNTLGVPANAIQVPLTVAHPTIIFRVDKDSGDAATFRQEITLQAATPYKHNPALGQTILLPEKSYAVPLKLLADAELEIYPPLFLTQLQQAVASPRTPTLSAGDSELVASFNTLSQSGKFTRALASGAKAAHARIETNYLENAVANHWIHYTNIGAWTANVDDIVDRASITEFLQYGNDINAASYFHAFVDGNDQPLHGGRHGYTITFPKGQQPDAKRFWSITAYTPDAIELVPNKTQTYNVASYTPNLKYNADGSLTLYFATVQPMGVSPANFVPIPPTKFNLMLRVYGPTGNTIPGADPSFMPPSIIPIP